MYLFGWEVSCHWMPYSTLLKWIPWEYATWAMNNVFIDEKTVLEGKKWKRKMIGLWWRIIQSFALFPRIVLLHYWAFCWFASFLWDVYHLGSPQSVIERESMDSFEFTKENWKYLVCVSIRDEFELERRVNACNIVL